MLTSFYLPPNDFTIFCDRLMLRKYFLQKAPPPLWHPSPFMNIQHPAISYYCPISSDGRTLNVFDHHDFFIGAHSRYEHSDIRIQESVEDWLNHIFQYAPFIFQQRECIPWLITMYHEVSSLPYWDWKEHFRMFCEQTLYSINDFPMICDKLYAYKTPIVTTTHTEIPLFH